jgi:hypothetical protein
MLSHQSTTEECRLPVSEDLGCGSVNPKARATSEDRVPSYDFNVYRSGRVKGKLNYMHANPVIRGLLPQPPI